MLFKSATLPNFLNLTSPSIKRLLSLYNKFSGSCLFLVYITSDKNDKSEIKLGESTIDFTLCFEISDLIDFCSSS